MLYILLIVIGLIWLVSALSNEDKKFFDENRNKKYRNRNIDYSKNLFERNKDIIDAFTQKIAPDSGESLYGRYPHSQKSYFFENLTRDCINEISLAENKFNLYPNGKNLSDWKPSAPNEWQSLANNIEAIFRDRKQTLKADEQEREKELREIQRSIKDHRIEFEKERTEIRNYPQLTEQLTELHKKEGGRNVRIDDIFSILTPNKSPWKETEKGFANALNQLKPFPLFPLEDGYSRNIADISTLNEEITEFNTIIEKIIQKEKNTGNFFNNIYEGYAKSQKDDVINYFNFVINNIKFPSSVPKIWDVDFDSDEGIFIVETKLPDVIHSQMLKEVNLVERTTDKPASLKEKKDIAPKIHPAILLRIAYEIFRNDDADIIKLLVLNGWVEFDDPNTGNLTRAYTDSLMTQKAQILPLNLSKLDPLTAFLHLKGRSAGKILDVIPIEPTLSLDKEDKRFVGAKEVLNKLRTETNLASMDWQDFEHLIRELFEKEFADKGAEVKITQASRDRGVDAVVFDPDPIKGGKYVIQAKRYTNTVDVSAVRDLCAVVRKEGASRGILVTTSTYGSDAYAFAQNEPVALLNGAELLGLLEKHGYAFRINMREAKEMNSSNK